MTGTHKRNMFQPDPDLHARLLSVGGTRRAGGNVLHMFRGYSSAWESGSHRVQSFLQPHGPLTASRFVGGKKSDCHTVGESTWKPNTPPDQLVFDFYSTLCELQTATSLETITDPRSQAIISRLGSFCQKTRRAPTVPTSRETAGAVSPHMSSILSDSGPSSLRAH